jgi:hypothetical protein
MITKFFDLVANICENLQVAREAACLSKQGNVEQVQEFFQQAIK